MARCFCIVIAAAVLLSTSAAAQQAATGELSGIVRDSGGAPIADVQLSIPAARLFASTDEHGRFRLAHIPLGNHAMKVRRVGFTPEDYSIEVTGEIVALELTLLPHAVTMRPVVVTGRRVLVRGVVFDSDLAPLQRAEVSVNLSARVFRTDRGGTFEIPELGPGKYLVRISAVGHATRLVSITVPEGEGLELSVRMEASSRGESPRIRNAWIDAGQRIRWASPGYTEFLTRQDLERGAAVLLSDLPAVRHLAGTKPCVLENGWRGGMPVEFYEVDRLEAVEVYSNNSVRGRHHYSTQSGCTGQVVVWLKTN